MKSKKCQQIGGQAVMEGVMMKSPNKIAIAVRKPNGKITVKKERYKPWASNWFLKLPIVRGVVNLIEMLVVGMKALTFSANESTEEEEEELTSFQMTITILLAIVAAILIFILAPFYLSKLVSKDTGLLFNIIDGLFRVAILFAYIIAISYIKDIRRMYQYHGAEHKSVHCLEAGKRLTVKNVKKFSTRHPRCGTAFLVIVVVVSIIVFSFLVDPRWYVKVLGRIVLIPVVAGLSYEILKIGAKYEHNFIMRWLILPGLWTQRFTTREPTGKQIEVAIKALKGVL